MYVLTLQRTLADWAPHTPSASPAPTLLNLMNAIFIIFWPVLVDPNNNVVTSIPERAQSLLDELSGDAAREHRGTRGIQAYMSPPTATTAAAASTTAATTAQPSTTTAVRSTAATVARPAPTSSAGGISFHSARTASAVPHPTPFQPPRGASSNKRKQPAPIDARRLRQLLIDAGIAPNIVNAMPDDELLYNVEQTRDNQYNKRSGGGGGSGSGPGGSHGGGSASGAGSCSTWHR